MKSDDASVPAQRTHTLSSTTHEQLQALIHGSMSAEFAVSVDDKPSTYPLTPFYDDDRGRIVVTSPVAFARKAEAVKRNPKVSILLHGDSGEYLVTGVATVREEIESNAADVRRLNDREPATPKRTANEKKYEFIETRLGRVLVGWLGHRIVIEIEPLTMDRIDTAHSTVELPAWPSIEMSATEAERYDRAILTVVDGEGYPSSHPISSITPAEDGSMLIDPEPAIPIVPGRPACLLFHWHDEASIKLSQRLVRGRLDTDTGTVRFTAASSLTLHNKRITDTIRFLLDGRQNTRSYFASRTPPKIRGLPVVGNTFTFLRNPFQFYSNLPAYGDIVQYSIGGNTWVALLHPRDIEQVLVRDSHKFARYNFEELGFDFIPDGLFFTVGEQWRRQRKTIQPAFAPRNVAHFSETMVGESRAFIESLQDGDVIVANEAFSDLTLEVLTTTLFDVNLDERRTVVTDAAHSLSNRVDTQSLSAVIPGWIPTRRNRDFARKMARFDAVVADLIEERRADDTPRNDLLSTLLALSETGSNDLESEIQPISDTELRDQLVTFLFAGHETTALVFTWVFLLLSHHDNVRQNVEQEIETVCGDKPPGVEDIPSLEYTETVIKEAMRYYPPIYVLFRKALEEVTVDGYRIPAGTKVVLPQFILHSDDRWWEDPLTFRPERWTQDGAEELPEYAYFPFGGGPRHCVGMRFAMMFLILGIVTIIQSVRFELVSDPRPDLHMAATLSPATDVELRVRKR